MSDNNDEIAVKFRMNDMMIDEAFENVMASSKAATFASMKQHMQQQQPMKSIYTIAKVRKLTRKFIESFPTNFTPHSSHIHPKLSSTSTRHPSKCPQLTIATCQRSKSARRRSKSTATFGRPSRVIVHCRTCRQCRNLRSHRQLRAAHCSVQWRLR